MGKISVFSKLDGILSELFNTLEWKKKAEV